MIYNFAAILEFVLIKSISTNEIQITNSYHEWQRAMQNISINHQRESE